MIWLLAAALLSVTPPTDHDSRIRIASEGYGSVSQAAATIATCESGNANVSNPRSSASGYWQFLDSTWEWVTGLEAPAGAYPKHIQREAFEKLWDNGKGRSHWRPSQHCWKGKL